MANMFERWQIERARYKLEEEERARQKQDEGSSSRQNVVQGSSSSQNVAERESSRRNVIQGGISRLNVAEGGISRLNEAEGSSSIQNVENEGILSQKVEKEPSKKGVKKLFSYFKTGSSKKNAEIGESLGDTAKEEEGSGKKMKTLFMDGLTFGSYSKKKQGIDKDHPYGDDEFLNYIAHNGILPAKGVRLIPGSSLIQDCLGHPLYQLRRRYDWKDIITGTQNRARAQFLGRGKFGELYRCDDPDSNSVAVKFHDPVAMGHKEFMAEIEALQGPGDENVIKMLGASFGPNHQVAIVYEYVSGGSLDQFILKDQRRATESLDNSSMVLNWEMRMSIALGVASAVFYVHNELKVIHRDVTLGNVILDNNLNPMLANFELAVPREIDNELREVDWQMKVGTCKGTPGYTAPETENYRTISTKCDVYSYGVLLFQLFTGLRAEGWTLGEWMSLTTERQRWGAPIIDDAIPKYSIQGLEKIYETARMCTNPVAASRPDMGQVFNMVRDAAYYVD